MNIFGFEITRRNKILQQSGQSTNLVPTQNPLVPQQQGRTIEIRDDSGTTHPVGSGRTSQPSELNLLSVINGEYALIAPKYPRQLLETLSHLAFWNYDISNAVFNIATMANTKFRYKFPDTTSESEAKKMREYLNLSHKKYYKGGIHSLISDLLTQVTVKGAISAEIVVNQKLNGIDRIVLVNVNQIQFYYSATSGRFIPYQTLTGTTQWGASVQQQQENAILPIGMIELNQTTYQYLPLQLFDDSPYGVPPLASALENIEIDIFYTKNARHAAKKLGTIGFMQVLLTPPLIKQGEGDEEYYNRCLNYINVSRAEIEKGVAQGISIGFKEQHEFKLQPTISDASGARELIELNDTKISTGLKQDGMLAGRPAQSISEATAKVILSKLSMQLGSFQMLVANFLAETSRIDLVLAGFGNVPIEIEFDQANVTDDLKTEQARQLKILNAINLRDQNIINQQTTANILGFDIAFGEAPPPLTVAKPEPYVNNENELKKKSAKEGKKDKNSDKNEL